MNKFDKPSFRLDVAEEMIKQLEAGTAPWQKPWEAGIIHERPFNPTTGKPYQGMNAFWLEMSGFNDPRWMTFRQAQDLGGKVMKGARAKRIEYWQWSEQKPILDEDGRPVLDETGKQKTRSVRLDRPRVFHAAVFNGTQIEGLEPYQAKEPSFDPLLDAEEILANTDLTILNDQQDRAFYRPMTDRIHLPAKSSFKGAYEYYATVLHEVGHATGAEHRMVRETGPFGSELYAKEELIAEMASYMVSRELGLGHYPERHAAYVGSWLQAIKEDRHYLFQAAAVAEKVHSWILEPENRKSLEQEAQKAFINSKADLQAHLSAGYHQEAKSMEDLSKRTYLAVPFNEKEDVKALGAKWDRKAKAWYVKEGTDLKEFESWIPKEPTLKAKLDPLAEFSSFIVAHGADPGTAVLADGAWHRLPLEGETGKKRSGSYRLFIDGLPAGQFKNFKTGETHKWVATGKDLSPEEKAQLNARAAKKALERTEQLKRDRAATAKRAYGIWMNAPGWATQKNSSYLFEKQVNGYGIKITDKGEVIIPLRDLNGRIHNLQSIKGDGTKLFLENGRKEGLFHAIDPRNKLKKDPKTILIAEGYSTAATLHEATGKPVIVAFDSGNLKPVAESLKKAFPKSKLILAADNDHHLPAKQIGINVGLVKAREAADLVEGVVIAPELTNPEKEKDLTDWNDLAQERGKKAIRKQLSETLGSLLSKDRSTDRQRTAELSL